MRAHYSTICDHPADEVWKTLRDFNGLATWYAPAVSESHILDNRPQHEVGAVRCFRMGEAQFTERLVELSDPAHQLSYTFHGEPPFPVTEYLSTQKVTPVTEGDRAFVEWWAEFECDPTMRQHWAEFFTNDVFRPGLASLTHHLDADTTP